MKKELREKYLKIRDSLSGEERRIKSELIMTSVLLLPETASANSISCYFSFGSEVDTKHLIELLLLIGKRVSVPYCDLARQEMQMVEIKSLQDISISSKIPQPKGISVVPKEALDVIIVPGICFDLRGYRIGFGNGFYDSYLKDVSATKIGLAFEEQIIERLPAETHDERVDIIVTDKRVIFTHKK